MEKYLKELELRNKEYNELLYSREYSRGVALSVYLNAIKTCNIKKIQSLLLSKRASVKAQRYTKKKKYVNKEFKTGINIEKYSNKKIVVYTCIIGNYDCVKEPIGEYSNIDYVCFTDNKKNIHKNTRWMIKEIPSSINFDNNTLINRYIKMHPYELFAEYDYAIYVDGNVKVCSYIGDYIERIGDRTGVAMYSHNSRECIYDEAAVCKLYRKGNKNLINQQINRYRQEGFPKKFGLYEATVFAVDIKNKNGQQILSEWWKEFILSQSYRDQLSLPYIIWKRKLDFSDIGIIGENIFEDKKISIYQHK